VAVGGGAVGGSAARLATVTPDESAAEAARLATVSPDESAAEAARLATVAALREKLARLGGLGGAAGRPRPLAGAGGVEPGSDMGGGGSAARHDQVCRVPRQPGFEPEHTAAGTAWVRRVEVDLGPLLAAAGVDGPADAAELAALVHRGGTGPPPGTGPAAARESPAAAPGPGAAAEAPILPLGPAAPIAVLDIESLGLRGSGVLAFLVGIGLLREGCLEVHQVLLAEPGDEQALLTALLDRLDDCSLLLTYNGRTFDLPVLRARCILNRLDDRGLDGRPHCDLLGPVRRLFRDRLGACTLRQAELGLLAMDRIDDVPGFEAPGRYRAWLRGAGPEVLAGVVRHNQLDLCATAVLGARLVAHVRGAMVQPVHPADRYRLALHLERHDAADRAERLLREAVAARAAPWDRRAAHRLALRLRRGGDAGRVEALAIWRALWHGDPSDLRGARALAIALERAGEHEEALTVGRAALRLCAAMPSWRHAALRGAPAGGWRADWERRVERLGRRAAQLALRSA